jgi:hypothetical protein
MTRRRRRVLIVFSVLVLLLGGLWWLSRPNLDPRFVGRWQCIWVPAESDEWREAFDIRPDGTAQFEGKLGPRGKLVDWHVTSDGQFAIENHLTGLDKLQTEWSRFVDRITGRMGPSGRNYYSIREASRDQIKLEYEPNPGAYIVLKRDFSADPVR